MDTARIAELLQPFGGESASKRQLDQIACYLDLLLRWNARVNLTAVREQEKIVTRHFGESLFAARHLFPDQPRLPGPHLIDLGAGAGFPGLAIKIWAPMIQLTLIESKHKKVAFLREVIRALSFTDAEVLAGRAEDFSGPRADVVTVRAVERFERILPIASRLTRLGGRVALLIGAAQLVGANRATDVQWSPPVPIPLSDNRILRIGTKIGSPSRESA